MTPDEAPVGTVCHVGHYTHGRLAQKVATGDEEVWMYLEATGDRVNFDDIYKSMTIAFTPGKTS